jgi:hypothetical protein
MLRRLAATGAAHDTAFERGGPRVIKRLTAAIAAFGLTLMLVAPALAVEINQKLPISSADFGVNTTGACHGSPTQDQLDWHFVLNQSDTNDQTLTVTFQLAGTITVSPDQIVDKYVLHYDVYTTGADTLLAASTSGDTGMLLLSDICGNPPPVIPEAPFSSLLVLTGGLAALGFVAWRMRRNAATA